MNIEKYWKEVLDQNAAAMEHTLRKTRTSSCMDKRQDHVLPCSVFYEN